MLQKRAEKFARACRYANKVVPLQPFIRCGSVHIRVCGHIMVWILLLCWAGNLRAETEPKGTADSLVVAHDSIAAMPHDSVVQGSRLPVHGDSILSDSVGKEMRGDGFPIMGDSVSGVRERPQKKSQLSGPVHYQSADSMIMMGNGTAYLHGTGDLKYESM